VNVGDYAATIRREIRLISQSSFCVNFIRKRTQRLSVSLDTGCYCLSRGIV
jgi:hypothetical protein